MVDGSTASMPDTPANQAAYPQSRSQKPGLGFPLARFVAIISLATGAVVDLAIGPYKGKQTGETSLLRALLERLKAGTILLGDQYFASYFGIAELVQRDINGVFRMHQRRKTDFRRGHCLGIEDHLVLWHKPKRPEWMDEATYEQIPDEMWVRELRFRVQQPGYCVQEIVLVTTLLDRIEYTKEELADLFLKAISAFRDPMRMADPEWHARLWEATFVAIAYDRVGNRPGRVESRCKKRRRKGRSMLILINISSRNALLDAA